MARRLVSKSSNVSDATLQKHIRAISGFKTTLESAQGEYRAALKAAKSDGVNTGQLIAAFSAKKREAEDVTGDLRQYLRYLALLNMPMTQGDLFAGAADAEPDDGDAEGSEDGEGGEDTEHQQWEAQQAGFKAGAEGAFKTTNPYGPGFQHDAWHAGWMKGQETLVTKGGVKRASARRQRSPATMN